METASSLNSERKRASFSLQKLKTHLYPDEIVKVKEDVYTFLQNDPLFRRLPPDASNEQIRLITYKRSISILTANLFTLEDSLFNPQKARAVILSLGEFDWSLVARSQLLKFFIQAGLFGLGTERHTNFITQLSELEIGGAFCLTEIGHGTNTRGMRTEAHYDVASQSFILHSPDFHAAKCWAGNLGETASHSIVFAQLFTADNKCHGLHAFWVPVRNPQTMKPYPGIKVANMGAKLGLNGVDNGVMMFEHYKIPRENLLNKTGDVSEEGVYVTPFKDPSKRLGASLGTLSSGRINIIGFGVVNLQKSVTIAIRYSAVRRQFGPQEGETEIPVLDYPLQQWRLFPYLAAAYLLDHFSKQIVDYFAEFRVEMMGRENPDRLAEYGQEIHALSSCGKPLSGWLARDSIQECREACGGHGYLSVSGFGDLRNDNDANCTYEGDNNVLLNQTSSWILSLWRRYKHSSSDQFPRLPMKTASYLSESSKSVPIVQDFDADETVGLICLQTLENLVRQLCESTSTEIHKLKGQGTDTFTVKNSTQVYQAHTLSQVYFHVVVLRWFYEGSVQACADGILIRPVLGRLFALYATTQTLPLLQFCNDVNIRLMTTRLQYHVLRLCRELRPDAVSLVDAVAPPDFCLNSALGSSDGNVYEHLEESMFGAEGALERPSYWQQMTYPAKHLKHKL